MLPIPDIGVALPEGTFGWHWISRSLKTQAGLVTIPLLNNELVLRIDPSMNPADLELNKKQALESRHSGLFSVVPGAPLNIEVGYQLLVGDGTILIMTVTVFVNLKPLRNDHYQVAWEIYLKYPVERQGHAEVVSFLNSVTERLIGNSEQFKPKNADGTKFFFPKRELTSKLLNELNDIVRAQGAEGMNGRDSMESQTPIPSAKGSQDQINEIFSALKSAIETNSKVLEATAAAIGQLKQEAEGEKQAQPHEDTLQAILSEARRIRQLFEAPGQKNSGKISEEMAQSVVRAFQDAFPDGLVDFGYYGGAGQLEEFDLWAAVVGPYESEPEFIERLSKSLANLELTNCFIGQLFMIDKDERFEVPDDLVSLRGFKDEVPV